ncbi:MAG: hypothetical protein IKZ88_03565 [Neisseriaceae bacterium]|nr:hypothetical protein [Neisseriaceae bacterium]
MNYAADALWWYLQDKYVRDLTSLLVSPSPIFSPNELPVRTLLGENGFSYLKKLNSLPETLHNFLQNKTYDDETQYLCLLLHFWLDYAPHAQLISKQNNLFQAKLDNQRYNIKINYQKQETNNINILNNFSGRLNFINRGVIYLPINHIEHNSNKWCGISTSSLSAEKDKRYRLLNHTDIAPVRATIQECYQNIPNGKYIVELTERNDKHWHEIQRYFII